jgi:hypothetical protein
MAGRDDFFYILQKYTISVNSGRLLRAGHLYEIQYTKPDQLGDSLPGAAPYQSRAGKSI